MKNKIFHIGVIIPKGNKVMELEANMIKSKKVKYYFTYMSGEKNSLTVEGIISQNKSILKCVNDFKDLKLDLIIYGCTSGSFIFGDDYDNKIINKIKNHCGIKTITTSSSVINALKILNIKNVSVLTPYPNHINKKLSQYLKYYEINVNNLTCLPTIDEINTYSSQNVYEYAKKIIHNKNDGIFISCTDLRTFEIIDILEKEINKPVVTSNQSTYWNAFKTLCIEEKVESYGKLFKQFL